MQLWCRDKNKSTWCDKDSTKYELHHLGKIRLNVRVENPNKQQLIPNWEEEVDFGPIYVDDSSFRVFNNDFYYTYKKVEGKSRTLEEVSFTNPIKLLNSDYLSIRQVMAAGLDPHQHPAVTHSYCDSELEPFLVPFGSEPYFGWKFIKISHKNSVSRKVVDKTNHYESYIFETNNSSLRFLLPFDLCPYLYQNAPIYVLDVLDLLDFGLIDEVPEGYHEHFIKRQAHKLLPFHPKQNNLKTLFFNSNHGK